MASLMATIHPMAKPAVTEPGDGGGAGNGAAAITANDFLTLLVNELKNQDPTAQTDPNEYINQLVQVNSLQQLIQMNQNLSSALGASATEPPTGKAVGSPAAAIQTGNDFSRTTATPQVHKLPITAGNLDVPQPTPAALRVAQALGGR